MTCEQKAVLSLAISKEATFRAVDGTLKKRNTPYCVICTEKAGNFPGCSVVERIQGITPLYYLGRFNPVYGQHFSQTMCESVLDQSRECSVEALGFGQLDCSRAALLISTRM